MDALMFFGGIAFVAIDGTHDTVETTGLTVVLLVALAVQNALPIAHETQTLVLPPLEDADLLAGDLRTRLELKVLAQSLRTNPSALHLFDGSLISTYLTLRRLCRHHSADRQHHRPNWWSEVADLLDREALARDWRIVLESSQLSLTRSA